MNHNSSCVLADRFTEARTLASDLAWILGFSLFTALAAQLEIRLPYTPVPITAQTFAVLLAGALLGSRRGFLSQMAYLAEGAAGLPVFAGGGFSIAHLMGPTGGYLWSYPVAAALIGWLVESGASRRTLLLAPALVTSDLLILASGVLWVHRFFGTTFRHALLLGFYPFIVGDLIKLVLIGFSLPRILNRSGRREVGQTCL
ncbi:MAG: biotin transporter BioY [Acidobacteria bacterium]|nr:MAG: biotin transporter BioY [Acidobacteriota bacterium]